MDQQANSRIFEGAKFWGKIVSFDNDPDSQPGATVLAIHPYFRGTKHVYPLRQLTAFIPSAAENEWINQNLKLLRMIDALTVEKTAISRRNAAYSDIVHEVGVARDQAGFIGSGAECIRYLDGESKRLRVVLAEIQVRTMRGDRSLDPADATNALDEIAGWVRSALK
jgi:hypothetical protein